MLELKVMSVKEFVKFVCRKCPSGILQDYKIPQPHSRNKNMWLLGVSCGHVTWVLCVCAHLNVFFITRGPPTVRLIQVLTSKNNICTGGYKARHHYLHNINNSLDAIYREHLGFMKTWSETKRCLLHIFNIVDENCPHFYGQENPHTQKIWGSMHIKMYNLSFQITWKLW